MELIVIRHGEPVRVLPEATGGEPADPHLTQRGHEQARRVAEWLRGERVDALLSSPKQRALETAAPISEALSLDIVVDDDIIEYDAAADHYIPMEEMRATGDPRLQAMYDGNWQEFGGEHPDVFRSRIANAMDRIVKEHAGQRVVAVCHGGVVNVMTAIVAGIDRHLWFDPGYTSISRIAASRNGIRSVVSVNECAHLEATRKPRS